MIKIINAWKFPIAILLCNTTVNTVQAEPILTPLESKHIEARYLEQSPLETNIETNANLAIDNENESNWLDYIPLLIDLTPTIFPEQSDQAIVPPVELTENQTWADQKQKKIRDWADRTAHKMDHWFGETNPEKPASATLRVLVDNRWNKYDNYDIKPRIRGRIKLPTLEKRLSIVFGDDSLDNEIHNNIAITNDNPSNDPNKSIDAKRIKDDNASIALRWSEISKNVPFDTDVDLGIRSGDDIYVRLKAEKDWTLSNNFSFHAEQIYRYGINSENYFRTNLELTHAQPNKPFVSNQFYLTYADEQDDEFEWDNRSYRQHQFFKGNQFNYGIYTGGFYNNADLRLNSWGPFVSWRQPVWREWFYVQGDLNYFNEHREDRSHYPSALVRLEALF